MQPIDHLFLLPVYYCLFYTTAMLGLYFDILYSTNNVQVSISAFLGVAVCTLKYGSPEGLQIAIHWMKNFLCVLLAVHGGDMSYTYQAEDRANFLNLRKLSSILHWIGA